MNWCRPVWRETTSNIKGKSCTEQWKHWAESCKKLMLMKCYRGLQAKKPTCKLVARSWSIRSPLGRGMVVVTVLLKCSEYLIWVTYCQPASPWLSWLQNPDSSSHPSCFLWLVGFHHSIDTQASIIVNISKSRVLITHQIGLNSFEVLVLVSQGEIIFIA